MSRESCCESEVGRRAVGYFAGQHHCAEAVARAVLEELGEDPGQAVRHATPFGGGMGRSFCETCGALTGGLIAIGHLHGRREPGADWKQPALMGSELRDKFLGAYGATGCGALLDRFGENGDVECARLVERMAGETFAVLREAAGK